MNILKLQELLERLVKLIEHECTGSPTELGQRLGVTDRTAKCYIAQLRDMGADIKYCTHLNSRFLSASWLIGKTMAGGELEGGGIGRAAPDPT
ncbi:MAG: HTH domain-containing protein, partial [Bacteroidales bacterium]|nr:HTH domain-containing protein [Bacteroidales bacterium]